MSENSSLQFKSLGMLLLQVGDKRRAREAWSRKTDGGLVGGEDPSGDWNGIVLRVRKLLGINIYAYARYLYDVPDFAGIIHVL